MKRRRLVRVITGALQAGRNRKSRPAICDLGRARKIEDASTTFNYAGGSFLHKADAVMRFLRETGSATVTLAPASPYQSSDCIGRRWSIAGDF